MPNSTSRVCYSNGCTCQYERGKEQEPKRLGKQLLSNYNPHRHGSEILEIYKSRISNLYAEKCQFIVAAVPPPFDKGRAWMPEIERPKFRKDAKPTERSYGKCDGAFRGIVRFLKGQCQCSCTDILTKLLMPCRYGKCFQRCWRYISLYSFNNNGFFGRHTRTPPTYHRGSSCLLIEGMYINFRCT